jgi:multisubunit Na+/H+ antiporter MnhB subunit
MNAARALVLIVVAVASVVVYLLMRRPEMRRPQFQGGRAFSVAVSLGCAVAVVVVFAWLAFVLQ